MAESTLKFEVVIGCEVCHKPLDNEYVRGRLNCGCWANMCPTCFRHFGLGLGPGLGKKFKLNARTKQWEEEK